MITFCYKYAYRYTSLLRRGLFVSQGDWGEEKNKSAQGMMGWGNLFSLPIVLPALTTVFTGVPTGASAKERANTWNNTIPIQWNYRTINYQPLF